MATEAPTNSTIRAQRTRTSRPRPFQRLSEPDPAGDDHGHRPARSGLAVDQHDRRLVQRQRSSGMADNVTLIGLTVTTEPGAAFDLRNQVKPTSNGSYLQSYFYTPATRATTIARPPTRTAW